MRLKSRALCAWRGGEKRFVRLILEIRDPSISETYDGLASCHAMMPLEPECPCC